MKNPEIYIAVNDRGPAEYISSLLVELQIPVYLNCSEIAKKAFNLNANYIVLIDHLPIEKDIKLVLTGTCLGDGVDKQAIVYAKENNIKSISIIEHWSHYRQRFILNDNLLLPDIIFVNDEFAKQAAIEDELPADKLVIVGNPKLELISKFDINSIISDEKISDLDLSNSIVFVSESLRDDVDLVHGIDEYSALEDLIKLTPKEIKIFIKLHPVESIEKYKKYSERVLVLPKLKNNLSICAAPIIFGMGSMLLIECAIFHRNVISYRPNEKNEFLGNVIGATVKASSLQDLSSLLAKKNIEKTNDFSRKFNGSTAKIGLFLKEFLHG